MATLGTRAGDADAAAAAAEALQRDWERRRAEVEQRYPDPDQADPQALRDEARLLYHRLQHVTTCRRPFPGWESAEPPAAESRSAEQEEIDRHLEEQRREADGARGR